MGLRIITDTSCDLPDEILQEYHIEMIPLKVTFENGDTFLDRFEIPPSVFVKKMAEFRSLPKTSAPDPRTFIEYFEKGIKELGEVLFISLSSGLSSTCQTARLACTMMETDRVKIFDTLTASLGTGIMAIKAAQMSAGGLSLDMIIKKLAQIRSLSENIFILDTLENVVKGGRLSRIEGMAGNLLNIKPVLRGNESGVPEVIEKVRGRKKAMNRFLTMMGELSRDSFTRKIVGISHVNCEEDARQLMYKISEKYHPQRILISEMSATIGTYAGEGALMVNF